MMRKIFCSKLNKETEGLNAPPFPGKLGEKIFNHISSEVWDKWVVQQTMLINEYRLNLIDLKSRQFLFQEMEKFFFGDGSTAPAGYTPEE